MRFLTMNSIYEVDEQNKRIRRLEGANDPTPNQGEDGVWREYFALQSVNGGYLIVWDYGGNRATLTSRVLEVIE